MTKNLPAGGLSKAKLILAAVLAIALIVLLLVGNVYQFVTKQTQQVTTDSLREEIVPVAKMTTYEYNFTQIMAIDDTGNPWELKNPITSKLYVATVDGTASIGVDAEKIECDSSMGVNGTLKSVSITLPHSEILSIDIDQSTLHPYADEGTFNKASKDDLNELYIKARQDQTDKVGDSGMLDKSDERVKELISNQIQSLYGNDVEVNVQFAV